MIKNGIKIVLNSEIMGERLIDNLRLCRMLSRILKIIKPGKNTVNRIKVNHPPPQFQTNIRLEKIARTYDQIVFFSRAKKVKNMEVKNHKTTGASESQYPAILTPMKVGVRTETNAVTRPPIFVLVKSLPNMNAGIGIKATMNKGERMATFVNVRLNRLFKISYRIAIV